MVVFVALALVASATVVPAVAGLPAVAVSGDDSSEATEGSTPSVSVTSTDVPERVTLGQQVDVSTRLVNHADRAGTQGVSFRLDLNGDGAFSADEEVGSETVALAPWSVRVVTFPATLPAGVEPGEYRYAVVTADETVEGDVTVGTPADYTLSVGAPGTATQGETVTIGAEVSNVGELDGTTTVEFRFDENGDGEFEEIEVSTRNLTLTGGASETAAFSLNVSDDLAPGTYAYAVSVDGVERTGNLTVERDAPSFAVPNVMGPDRIREGGTTSVSAIVKNVGEDRRNGLVEVYVDVDGDGEYSADELVRSRTTELGAGSSELHSFNVRVPARFGDGDVYSYAVVTSYDTHEETVEVYKRSRSTPEPTETSEPTETPEPTATPEPTETPEPVETPEPTETPEPVETPDRDDVAQALYNESFEDLDADEAWQVQDVTDRLPAEGVDLEDVRTLSQLSQQMYGKPWLVDSHHKFDEDEYTLTREEAIAVQNAYDAQFGPLPTDPEYTREQITNAVYPWVGEGSYRGQYGFNETKPYQAARVLAIYNRQPFADGVTDEDVRTRRQMLNSLERVYLWEWQSFGSEVDALDDRNDLSLEDVLEIQREYDEQFGDA